MAAVRVLRKVRRLTISSFLTSIRVGLGLSVPLWWQEGAALTHVFFVLAVVTAWASWFFEPGDKEIPPFGRALNPLADKLFILPIFWLVGVTTVDWALIILAAYTTWYDISMVWQRRVIISLAWKGVPLLQLPTTILSRTKTVLQYVLVLLLALPDLATETIVMLIVVMIMTVVAWSSHLNDNLK